MILDDTTPKITINDLKTVFNDNTAKRNEKLKSLKNKLDLLAVQETDIDIVFLMNKFIIILKLTQKIVLFIMYGYITNHFTKSITCDVCRTAVIGILFIHRFYLNKLLDFCLFFR